MRSRRGLKASSSPDTWKAETVCDLPTELLPVWKYGTSESIFKNLKVNRLWSLYLRLNSQHPS